MHIWLRDETKKGERRTPLTPTGAQKLLRAGFQISVEASANRIFPDIDYKVAGCQILASGTWRSAPKDAVIFGLKELSDGDFPLTHHHIYFAHAYKEQKGWKELLGRFVKGHGKLSDLEFLTDKNGRRVAAFGYWAGFAGTVVAIKAWSEQLKNPKKPLGMLTPYANSASCLEELKTLVSGEKPSVILIGALGRCGQGAAKVAQSLGLPLTKWDKDETLKGGPFAEILDHDIFVNCVLLHQKVPHFLTQKMLTQNRKLKVVCDVSCDPTGPVNPLPIYRDITTLFEPTRRLTNNPTPLDLIAIDHLPALLPKESSEDFESQLLPHLLDLKTGSDVWQSAEEIFVKKVKKI